MNDKTTRVLLMSMTSSLQANPVDGRGYSPNVGGLIKVRQPNENDEHHSAGSQSIAERPNENGMTSPNIGSMYIHKTK